MTSQPLPQELRLHTLSRSVPFHGPGLSTPPVCGEGKNAVISPGFYRGLWVKAMKLGSLLRGQAHRDPSVKWGGG